MAPPAVPLDIVRSANASLVGRQSLVAVFVGGTSGIGEYTIRALAGHCSKNCKGLRLYIVGRNAEAANSIIADCQELCPKDRFQFVKADDLSLIKDVDRCCDEIIKLEQKESDGPARVDLLVMSQADLHFGGRRETTEGLDKSMSLYYYSRIRFITKLMPLLAASERPSHVISICLAGKEVGGKLFTEDLSLRDPGHYSFLNVRTHVVHMKTMSFEAFAQQNPGQISFVHVFPGLVITPVFNGSSLPLWFRIIWPILAPIAGMFAVKPQEIGERVLGFASDRFPPQAERQAGGQTNGSSDIAKSTDDVGGGGAYSTNYDGRVNSVQEAYQKLRPDGFGKRVWDHTMKVFEEIEAGTFFKG